MPPPTHPIPSSILIIGSGVFGLSTAYSLSQRPELRDTRITLLDRLPFPAPDAASVDASRIVRSDYPDFAYGALAAEALRCWRGEWGAEGRYTEAGLALVRDQNGSSGARGMVDGSLANVLALGLKKEDGRQDGGEITVLESEDDVRTALPGFKGAGGECGYVNWTSGWADAEAGLRYLRRKVEALGRVDFRTAEVARLILRPHGDSQVVHGVELTSSETLTADLTILAAGAWTGKFVDLRGVATATGQTLAYLDITPAEQARLARNAVLLNADSHMYIIPPAGRELKVARHGYGYANPRQIPHPERQPQQQPGDSAETITVSLPRTKQDDADLNIAPEGLDACRAYLARCMPELADRPWAHTRVCWYCDTVRGDWLVDFHPRLGGLFLATGGSGHAYKFLPVVGERVVDVLLGAPRDALGEELRRLWRWPESVEEKFLWTNEWRGGRRGMVLDEELARR